MEEAEMVMEVIQPIDFEIVFDIVITTERKETVVGCAFQVVNTAYKVEIGNDGVAFKNADRSFW